MNGEATSSMPASIAHSMPAARLLGSLATWRNRADAISRWVTVEFLVSHRFVPLKQKTAPKVTAVSMKL